MQNSLKYLGCNIKKYRKARNLTQAELAEKSDIDFKYLSRLETGLALPSLKTLESIAQVLKISIEQLFETVERVDINDLKHEIYEKIEIYSLEQLSLLRDLLNVIDSH